MKYYSVILTVLLVYTFSFTTLTAASVEVQWKNPEKYRDIESGEQSDKSFRNELFKDFEKYFVRLADKLATDLVLKIEVTDLDLAGDIRYGAARQLRVVSEAFYPRMELSYQLLNSDQTVATSGTVKLKDMMFMQYIGPAMRNDNLKHEKKMLGEWFNKTFASYLVN